MRLGQHRVDDQNRPARDWESTTYISSFKSIDQFGPLLRQEPFRQRFGTAVKAVVLIDGAIGLANMGRLTFPGCTQIVDFYHTMEHAGWVLEALLGKTHLDYQSRLHRWAERLLHDEVDALIAETRQECAGQPCAPAVEAALHYSATNLSRMQYEIFLAAGSFIGFTPPKPASRLDCLSLSLVAERHCAPCFRAPSRAAGRPGT